MCPFMAVRAKILGIQTDPALHYDLAACLGVETLRGSTKHGQGLHESIQRTRYGGSGVQMSIQDKKAAHLHSTLFLVTSRHQKPTESLRRTRTGRNSLPSPSHGMSMRAYLEGKFNICTATSCGQRENVWVLYESALADGRLTTMVSVNESP